MGEAYIEDVFRKNGFKILHPESMSLREQIAYLKGAKTVAGVIGTATHMEVLRGKVSSRLFGAERHANRGTGVDTSGDRSRVVLYRNEYESVSDRAFCGSSVAGGYG